MTFTQCVPQRHYREVLKRRPKMPMGHYREDTKGSLNGLVCRTWDLGLRTNCHTLCARSPEQCGQHEHLSAVGRGMRELTECHESLLPGHPLGSHFPDPSASLGNCGPSLWSINTGDHLWRRRWENMWPHLMYLLATSSSIGLLQDF